jgi:hypothetical protein
VAALLERLAPRERALLGVAAGIVAAAAAAAGVHVVTDHVATFRARVAGRERELDDVRRLAAALRRQAPGEREETEDGGALLARLEAAASATVGRERIAGMTPVPATSAEGRAADRIALRVTGASLADVVRLLHTLETGPPPLALSRLELRKHPDEPTRFDAVVEVAP